MEINDNLGKELMRLGIIPDPNNPFSKVRDTHVGNSNYSHNLIQPWSIWQAYPNLDAFSKDVIKRVLRVKKEPNKTMAESRMLDWQKIEHIAREKQRQIYYEIKNNNCDSINLKQHEL